MKPTLTGFVCMGHFVNDVICWLAVVIVNVAESSSSLFVS